MRAFVALQTPPPAPKVFRCYHCPATAVTNNGRPPVTWRRPWSGRIALGQDEPLACPACQERTRPQPKSSPSARAGRLDRAPACPSSVPAEAHRAANPNPGSPGSHPHTAAGPGATEQARRSF